MSYQNNILFRTGEEFDNSAFDAYKAKAEQNYKLAPFDYITVQVFTNDGEIILDPNGDFTNELNENGATLGRNNNQFETDPSGLPQNQGNLAVGGGGGVGGVMMGGLLRRFPIWEDDSVRLPLIGSVLLAGLTLEEANKVIANKMSEYYENPFVITRYVNKRVIVMGGMGNHIVPLNNENMTILEVLALAGNFDNNVRSNRVRLIRNTSTGNPVMKNIDLSTWEGVKSAELKVMPNDVIYIEPRRRVGSEFLADFGQVASAIGSSVTIILTVLLLQDRFRNDP